LSRATQIAKDMLPTLLQEGGSPRALVEAKGLLQISDTSALEVLVLKIVAENPKQARAMHSWPRALESPARFQVEEFRGGRDKLKGFFVGQIMKSSGGRANPAVVEQLLMARLRGPD
jgi:aspartyl-tRNA(Asn)/glutamyl-tRNA(Gln) amidotransferase subunit B